MNIGKNLKDSSRVSGLDSERLFQELAEIVSIAICKAVIIYIMNSFSDELYEYVKKNILKRKRLFVIKNHCLYWL